MSWLVALSHFFSLLKSLLDEVRENKRLRMVEDMVRAKQSERAREKQSQARSIRLRERHRVGVAPERLRDDDGFRRH